MKYSNHIITSNNSSIP